MKTKSKQGVSCPVVKESSCSQVKQNKNEGYPIVRVGKHPKVKVVKVR